MITEVWASRKLLSVVMCCLLYCLESSVVCFAMNESRVVSYSINIFFLMHSIPISYFTGGATWNEHTDFTQHPRKSSYHVHGVPLYYTKMDTKSKVPGYIYRAKELQIAASAGVAVCGSCMARAVAGQYRQRWLHWCRFLHLWRAPSPTAKVTTKSIAARLLVGEISSHEPHNLDILAYHHVLSGCLSSNQTDSC
jgi:hypothetical protein